MSNLSILNNQVLTMSHYQIADLVLSRPDSVKRTMERLSERGVIELTPVVGVNHLGQKVNEYHVDKRNSYIVVAQLSPEFTALLVDRWQELESQQAPQVPQTYAAALLEAGRLALAIEEKDKQLALAAPKVQFYDLVVSDNSTFSNTNAAKKLNQRPRAFIEWLRKEGYIGIGGIGIGDMPIQRYINQGLFVTHTGFSKSGYHYTQARITGKGLTYFADKLAKLDKPL